MTGCQMPAEQCDAPATAVLRITGVGDRAMCEDHIEALERMGMSFRRLDPDAPVPMWRQRAEAKDLTGLPL